MAQRRERQRTSPLFSAARTLFGAQPLRRACKKRRRLQAAGWEPIGALRDIPRRAPIRMFRDHLFRVVCALFIVGGTSIAVTSCGNGEVIRGSKGKPYGSKDASVADGPSSTHLHLDAGTGSQCTPKTCDALGFTCGANSDGCGNVLQCGACSGSDYCGGGGYSRCGNPQVLPDGAVKSSCVRKTCADYPANTCGQQSDGCGGLTDNCSSCTASAFCGGGGPSLCGTGTAGGADAMVCVPKTCADYPTGTCGRQSDGCGSLTPNCTACQNPEFCGGNPAHPNTCGGNNGLGIDGGPTQHPCKPKACADFPTGTCGIQGDGCGGTTPHCSTCTSPRSAAAAARTCAEPATPAGRRHVHAEDVHDLFPRDLRPAERRLRRPHPELRHLHEPRVLRRRRRPASAAATTANESDGGVISKCMPATCASLGYTCGQAGDGCGGIIGPCGPRVRRAARSAAAVASRTSAVRTSRARASARSRPRAPAAARRRSPARSARACKRARERQVRVLVPRGPRRIRCPASSSTSRRLGAQPFDARSEQPAGRSAASAARTSRATRSSTTTTDFDGTFTLTNVPVSKNATGHDPDRHPARSLAAAVRLHRSANACDDQRAPQDLNMPSTSAEGDIPLTAISTGSYDPIECVLLKMGVAQSEFTSLRDVAGRDGDRHDAEAGPRARLHGTQGGGGNAQPGRHARAASRTRRCSWARATPAGPRTART